MSLSIFSANRVEFLQQQLAYNLAQNPLESVLQREIIVVPTYAMARWLNLELASDLGIAANIDFPSPSAWIWSLISQKNQLLPFQRENMQWQLFEILPGMLEQKGFETIAKYISAAIDEVPLWQLCGQIANNFEAYLKYRPELIRQWSNEPLSDWQSKLWIALCKRISPSNPVELIDQLLLNPNSKGNSEVKLPSRISLFALSSLPALYIDVIHHLSSNCDITLYVHSPTYHYWADLVSKKSAAQKRLAASNADIYFETGNELLASWGKQGQALQDLLLTHSALSQTFPERYEAPGHDSLLRRIQQSIFDLETDAVSIEVDDSVQIDICHSPMRECQVLHDNLLTEFDLNPQLKPEDIIVMIPEIGNYAPTIEAVFHARADNTNYIPWNISDITTAQQHPLVLSFLQLLDLSGSRFKNSEILSLLDVDNICLRFGIDSKNRETIKHNLSKTRIRWGIDDAHKESLGQEPFIQNTWKQSRQRLFAGYAMKEVDLWNGIAPVENLESDAIIDLSKFWFFFDKLVAWANRLQTDQPIEQWQITLHSLVDDFYFEDETSSDSLQVIREKIGLLNNHDKTSHSISFIQYWMNQQLSSSEIPGRLFSGGVTFCGMRPMRSLPFKLVCLLGMNDGAFPRKDSRNSFDLMKDKWRAGDPAARDEDRYLMLETLLSTREKLRISYCGRDSRDDSERQPSIVVKELTDYIDTYFTQENQETPFSKTITTLRPLQPFSAKNYGHNKKGYDPFWFELATHEPDIENSHKTKETLPVEQSFFNSDDNLSAANLIQFLAHPIEYFFRHQLGIHHHTENLLEDNESFSLDGLDLWAIKQKILESFTQQNEPDVAQWLAQGILPHSEAAYIDLDQIKTSIEELITPIAPFIPCRKIPKLATIEMKDGISLQFNCTNYYTEVGLLHINSARLKPKSLFGFWIEHLLLSAGEIYQASEQAILISRDDNFTLAPIDPETAIQLLQSFVDLFEKGQSTPLAVFPLSTFTWAFTQNVNKTLLSWQGNSFSNAPCDINDRYLQIFLRDQALTNPVEHIEFEHLSRQLYGDFLQFCGENNAE